MAHQSNSQPGKALAIVCYLAVANEACGRKLIAALMWPQANDARAQANLRRNLVSIRQVMGDNFIEANRRELRLNACLLEQVDINLFRNVLAKQKMSIEALAEIAKLYRGRFMEGFTIKDTVEFNAWCAIEADNFEQKAVKVFEQLVEYHVHHRNFDDAFSYIEKWLAIDPLAESAHRYLMYLHGSQGNYEAALEQYQVYSEILDDNLGIEPDPITVHLYTALSRHELPSCPSSSIIAPVLNTPYITSPFVGREVDLTEIKSQLKEDRCRLLTIVGPGGIGKTRTAIEVASRYELITYKYFVSLASTTSVEALIYGIADAVDFSFYGSQQLLAQLIDYLRHKKVLLILDSFEQLVSEKESVLVLKDIIQSTLYTKFLVTSREALKLPEEYIYEIRAMLEKEAQALFIQEAKRIDATINLSGKDYIHIKEIGRCVGYLPLGIKLAASWLSLLTCEEIANELGTNIVQLESIAQNIEQKHQSLKIVFDTSWRLMNPFERRLLCELAVFAESGFSLKAVKEVIQIPLVQMFSLLDKSLIYTTQSNRFRIYSVLYPFVEQKLGELDELDEIYANYSRYFGNYSKSQMPLLLGEHQHETIHNITLDIDNIKRAWGYALDTEDFNTIESIMEMMYRYHEMRHRFEEGATYLEMALNIARLASPDLRVSLAIRYAWFCINLRRFAEAGTYLKTALSEARERYLLEDMALAYNHLGVLETIQKNFEDGDFCILPRKCIVEII